MLIHNGISSVARFDDVDDVVRCLHFTHEAHTDNVGVVLFEIGK